MPADGIGFGGHWGPLGELVRSRAAKSTRVELDPLYEYWLTDAYWQQLLPRAYSVDDAFTASGGISRGRSQSRRLRDSC